VHSIAMGFWQSLTTMDFWRSFVSNLAAEILAVVAAVLLALVITERYTARLAKKRASHERDLAAAEELYRVYGLFFAAWKSWEYHSRWSVKRVSPPASPDRRDQLISEAASAEGTYEAFVIRVSLEQDLSLGDRAAMCCLRIALKQLRYAIRDGEPLTWWRSGHSPEYEAFKMLMPRVAGILVDSNGSTSRPTREARTSAIAEITGNADAFLRQSQFSLQSASGPTPRAAGGRVPDWVVLANLVCPSDARIKPRQSQKFAVANNHPRSPIRA
jgi:hypothetical protein